MKKAAVHYAAIMGLLFQFIVLSNSSVFATDPCDDFAVWLKAHPAASAAGNGIAAYREDLIHSGIDAKAVDQKIADLFKVLVRCPGANSQTFDRTYKSEAAPFNTEPNAFMVEAARDLKPGRALDVAMGQGRNSIYLAKTGWEVTGFDISAEGLAVAQMAAAEAGVKINTVHQGWESFDFGKERWDLIVLSYAWIPVSDAGLLRRICDSLRPGGSIVFEGYLVDDPNSTGMWPGPNQLLKIFQGDLRILRYEDVEAVSDWRNRRKDRIVRLLARK